MKEVFFKNCGDNRKNDNWAQKLINSMNNNNNNEDYAIDSFKQLLIEKPLLINDANLFSHACKSMRVELVQCFLDEKIEKETIIKSNYKVVMLAEVEHSATKNNHGEKGFFDYAEYEQKANEIINIVDKYSNKKQIKI